MSCLQANLEEDCPSPEEIQCQICYHRYNAYNRKPKILDCLHRACLQCLDKMLEINSGVGSISCPFCRQPTTITEFMVSTLPDDINIMSQLEMKGKPLDYDHYREVDFMSKCLPSSSPSQAEERIPCQIASIDIYVMQSPNTVSMGSNESNDQPTSTSCKERLIWLIIILLLVALLTLSVWFQNVFMAFLFVFSLVAVFCQCCG